MPVRYVNRETERFAARGSDGKTYTVVEMTRFAEVYLLHEDTVSEITPTGKSFIAYPGGRPVNVDEGVMILAGTNITLTRM